MKRYGINARLRIQQEEPAGEWVRFEDVAPLISERDHLDRLVAKVQQERFQAGQERDAALAQVAPLIEALLQMLKSARPHPVEHPSMTRAWAKARETLEKAGVKP